MTGAQTGAPVEDESRRIPDAGPTRPGWSRTRTAGGLQPEEPERLDGDPEGEEEPEEEHGDQRDAAQVLGHVDVLLGRARRQQAAGADAASAELGPVRSWLMPPARSSSDAAAAGRPSTMASAATAAASGGLAGCG